GLRPWVRLGGEPSQVVAHPGRGREVGPRQPSDGAALGGETGEHVTPAGKEPDLLVARREREVLPADPYDRRHRAAGGVVDDPSAGEPAPVARRLEQAEAGEERRQRRLPGPVPAGGEQVERGEPLPAT